MNQQLANASRTAFFAGKAQEWVDSNWRAFIASPDDMPLVERAQAHTIAAAGIYFLWLDETALLYVGLSCDIGSRLLAHVRAGRIPFTHASFIGCWPDGFVESERMVEVLEAAYVHQLEPPFNSFGCPSMRHFHGELRAEVAKLWRPVDHLTGEPL